MIRLPRRAALAAGLSLPTAAAGLGALSAVSSLDVELLATCAEYHDAVAKIEAWDSREDPPKGSQEAIADEAYCSDLCGREDAALIKACTLPARSLDGLHAKAAMLEHVMTWGIKDCSIETGCPQVELTLSFVEDVQRLLGHQL
ncbi:hypothetical protein [Teichococcus aestuarii]|uniref:hypothetical protein n=1 Tax=Teichococcus aestuarii TaxID=568898 RepID=UPI003617D8A2